jgi:hypothetical protein
MREPNQNTALELTPFLSHVNEAETVCRLPPESILLAAMKLGVDWRRCWLLCQLFQWQKMSELSPKIQPLPHLCKGCVSRN